MLRIHTQRIKLQDLLIKAAVCSFASLNSSVSVLRSISWSKISIQVKISLLIRGKKFPSDKNSMCREAQYDLSGHLRNIWNTFLKTVDLIWIQTQCVQICIHNRTRLNRAEDTNKTTAVQTCTNEFQVFNHNCQPTSLTHITHLGGCCDSSISSQVETPLSKPHHGLITLVSGLCNVLIYLLKHKVTDEWEEWPHQGAKRKITD